MEEIDKRITIRHRVATFPRSLPSVILRWRGKKNVGESLNLCQPEETRLYFEQK